MFINNVYNNILYAYVQDESGNSIRSLGFGTVQLHRDYNVTQRYFHWVSASFYLVISIREIEFYLITERLCTHVFVSTCILNKQAETRSQSFEKNYEILKGWWMQYVAK